jgi:hypothetical protein
MELAHRLSPRITEKVGRLLYRITQPCTEEIPDRKSFDEEDEDSLYYSPPRRELISVDLTPSVGSETSSFLGDWAAPVYDKVSKHKKCLKKAAVAGALTVGVGLPALVAVSFT